MLPNKVFGKYDWNINGKTGIGAALGRGGICAAYAGVGGIYVGADVRLGCADQGQSERGRWYGCCFPCLAC